MIRYTRVRVVSPPRIFCHSLTRTLVFLIFSRSRFLTTTTTRVTAVQSLVLLVDDRNHRQNIDHHCKMVSVMSLFPRRYRHSNTRCTLLATASAELSPSMWSVYLKRLLIYTTAFSAWDPSTSDHFSFSRLLLHNRWRKILLHQPTNQLMTRYNLPWKCKPRKSHPSGTEQVFIRPQSKVRSGSSAAPVFEINYSSSCSEVCTRHAASSSLFLQKLRRNWTQTSWRRCRPTTGARNFWVIGNILSSQLEMFPFKPPMTENTYLFVADWTRN